MNDSVSLSYIYNISNINTLKLKTKCIPFINYEKIDNTNIINSLILLIKKHTKEVYGSIKVKDIITKENDEYRDIIKEYGICELDNLYFIKFNKIKKYKLSILIKNLDSKLILPKMNQLYNIYNFDCYLVLELIKKYINKINLISNNTINIINNKDNEEEDNKEEDNEDKEDNEDNEDNEEDKDKTIYFNIPILWIPCSKLLKYIKNNKISKPTIKKHYTKCITCEINNNNRLDIDFENKIILNNCKEKDEIESIINRYLMCSKYENSESKIREYEYIEDKINIIWIKDEKHKYNECLFIIF